MSWAILVGGVFTLVVWLASLYVTYVTVLPMVPLDGWAWLVAGVVAFVVAKVVAGIVWFLVAALLIGVLTGGEL